MEDKINFSEWIPKKLVYFLTGLLAAFSIVSNGESYVGNPIGLFVFGLVVVFVSYLIINLAFFLYFRFYVSKNEKKN